MMEHQLEAVALWTRPREKQLREATQDGKGFCRRGARGGLEQVENPKCNIA